MVEIEGFFTLEREEYHLQEPIWAILNLRNKGEKDVYVFIPRGRANGIQLRVKVGSKVAQKDMTTEPEPGLVPQVKIAPGETHTQKYLLTQWLSLMEPGDVVLECAIHVEASDVSLAQTKTNRVLVPITVVTDLSFRILPT